MSKKVIIEKKISDDYLAKYYIIKEITCENETAYGIEIELYDKLNLKTHEIVRKFTNSHEKAIKIIEILADKNVTPNSLLYVIDEIFDKVSKK